MQKHADKLQQEKEENSMASIKGEMPNISPAVLALALQEARWEVPAAIQLVSLFLQGCGIQLEDLKQVSFFPAVNRDASPACALVLGFSRLCMRNGLLIGKPEAPLVY